MRLDLHMHSFYSDGIMNLEQIIEAVKKEGIDIFSLTDHDIIAGCDQMALLAKKAGLKFIKGVEVACSYEGKEYHLTTYGYKDENLLKEILDTNLECRKQFDLQMIEICGLDIEKFKDYEDDPYLGGWPSLNYLKQHGVIKTFDDYFEIVSKKGLKLTFDSPEFILPRLKACGAKVFLAHPSAYFKGPLALNILDVFREFGIDGLECYSPYTRAEEEIQYYLDYCSQHNLYRSGGSDYHGGFVGRKLGRPFIDDSMVSGDLFMKLVER